MLPAEVTLAVVGEELVVAERWAQAHNWQISLDRQRLVLDVLALHPVDRQPLLLTAEVDAYRALPPAWRFVDPVSREATPAATPSRDPLPNGKSSVIYGVGVICAHFSRTAYSEYQSGGPHNWSLTTWDHVTEGVQAHTIAEMLAVIHYHLSYSKGRLG